MSNAIAAPPVMIHNEREEPRPMKDLRRDADLLDAFLAGEDRAFVELFDRHHHRLFLYCARIVGNADHAEDVMQEVWLRLIRMRDEGRRKRIEQPLGLLITIVRNLSLNHVKRERRSERLDERDAERVADAESNDRNALEESVVAALEALPMKYREPLVLHVYSGYDFGEIAAMLDISVEAAWKRASRGRARLKEVVLAMQRKSEQQ